MLNIVGLVVRWFPVIWGVVMSLEVVMNPTTTGAQKREGALAALVKFFRGVGVTLTEAQIDSLGRVIDGIVAVLNITATFRHKADSVELSPEAGTPQALAVRVGDVVRDDPALANFIESTR